MYTKQLSVYLKNTYKECYKRVSCKINVHRAVNSAFSNAESAFPLPAFFAPSSRLSVSSKNLRFSR